MSKKKNKNKSSTKSDDLNAKLEKEFFDGDAETKDDDFQIDPKLLRKMRPQWHRNPYISLVVAPIIIFLIYLLYQDFIFGVKGLLSKKPQDWGDITKKLKDGPLQTNKYVTIKGVPFVQSLIPVPIRGKGGKAKGYYLYFILQDTDNSVLVKLKSKTAQFVGNIPGIHTGRLLHIKDVSEGKRIRSYIANDKNNRVDHDIQFNPLPWDRLNPEKLKIYNKNLKALEKGEDHFSTDTNQEISPGPAFHVDVKLAFATDTFVTFDRGNEISKQITVEGGIYTPETCIPGYGGDVILKLDPTVFALPSPMKITGSSLKGVVKPDTSTPDAKGSKIKPQPACKWKSKTANLVKKDNKKSKSTVNTLPPKIVRVPATTKVTDIRTGKEIPFSADGKIIIKGAKSGEIPKSYKLKLIFYPFDDIDGCYNWFITKNYPFAKIDKSSNMNDGKWQVTGRIPEQDLALLKKNSTIKKICDNKAHGGICTYKYPPIYVRPRTAYIFNARYSDIKVQGDELIILNARKNFPVLYKEEKSKFKVNEQADPINARVLIPKKSQSVYKTKLASLNKFKFYPPTIVPDDAYILLTNEHPRDFAIMWKIPVVLILLLLLIFNINSVLKKFMFKKS